MKVKINGGMKQQKKNEFIKVIYGIMKLACKWMNLEKKTHPEQSNPDPERQT